MTDTTEAVYELLQMVRPLHRRVARSVAEHLKEAGIGVGERAVLALLVEGEPRSVPAIGRALFLPRQNVQKWVDGLLRAGLVERRPNPAHRRSHLIAATDEGRDLFAQIRARETRAIAELAGRLSPSDVKVASDVLAACLEHFSPFEDDPDRPGPLA
ncbi:MarR family winged helix-turn-helix transcriptional regulator [Stappia indica]|uniref:MarR family winged helix-turn-helix transcriptional regulator n=1 Tax=Stappia indica TaxID=538381 RepID=UPI001CD76AE4|nr:MarR family transcriptional regulator [Stappia indica]MCA1297791.1 MarR family transcriptional regulator [Stappia indica]